jgi:hypothetical protein
MPSWPPRASRRPENAFLVPAHACGAILFRGELPRHIANRNLVLVESELHCDPRARASIHRRNRELRAFLDAGGQRAGDRLGLGVEADRIRAVLVESPKPDFFQPPKV